MSNRNKRKSKDTVETYICNPALNKACDARFQEGWCGVECFCTRRKDFAADPLKPLDEAEYNKQWAKRHYCK